MPALPAYYNNLPDAALLKMLAQQDEFAFKEVYQRYADALYRTAFKRLPIVHKAEDFVQEVFLSLYRQRHTTEEIVNLKAWLFACLRNCILNEIRNFNTHKKHDLQIATHTPLTTLSHSEYDLKKMEVQFHNALQQLTDRSRQVFLMSRTEHLPNKKIAEQLNISVHAVEKHITSALRVMKREMGKHEMGMIILFSLL